MYSPSISPTTPDPRYRFPHGVDHYHDDSDDEDSGYDNDDDKDDSDDEVHHDNVHHNDAHRRDDVHGGDFHHDAHRRGDVHGGNFHRDAHRQDDVHSGDFHHDDFHHDDFHHDDFHHDDVHRDDAHHGDFHRHRRDVYPGDFHHRDDVHHGDDYYDINHSDDYDINHTNQYDVNHGNHSSNRHRRNRNGHHKKRNSRSAFSMDLLRTAVTTLGDAVMNGRDDGQRRIHNRQRPVDYNPQSLNPWGNKTADQVYETLVQAAYTLGEVVGDLEHKFGINPDEARKSRNGRRRSKHRDVEDGYDREYPNEGNDGYSKYDDEFYNLPQQQRPNPLRRPSSNPELGSSYHQHEHDDNNSNRSSRSSTSSKSSRSDKHSKRKRIKSLLPTYNQEKSMKETILHQLPGLLTRAAFILELRELKQNNKDRGGMAGKYAMLLMAVKIIEQLGQEYVCYCEKSGNKK